ncbi:branched-chain amino acid ABC transporter substrate-binding protein [Actinoplanes sp. NBRC 103695]|uniref:branched-chain amino acid ABC transporter substrate-binding protein n=1 Tax=Actinoplanes sp. NBRC 103695 TaxID=3032202 RepID=UPI0024A28389|nr:branched-chain amino acid ABC transporter substrate-binding protein [Actinoplanes sp. NBRC 103695]GLZ01784.1 putative ABC transporter/extracellular ligand-binding receptor [Actinoplanes sp. NBRC 103695]
MRRNDVRVLGAVGLAVAMLATAGCQDSGTAGGGDTTAAACGGKIAIFGAFTGADAGQVLSSLNGAKLAVKKFNTANPDCKVTMQEFDTQGAPDQATPIANQIAQDQSFVAVVGGHFSGESKATMPIYEAAGMVMVSPEATAAELTTGGNKAFHRVVGNDNSQGGAAVEYLKNVAKSKNVFLVDDGSTYGAGIIATVKQGLGSLAAGADKVQKDQTNFDATISKIKGAKADTIAYGGYTNEAAPLLKQARASGVKAKFIGFDGLYDPNFPKGAGEAAEGASVLCPCGPVAKAGGTFGKDYEAEYREPAGAYGAEGFDATTVLLDGFKAGKKTRADLLAWVDAYDKQGVSKNIKFDQNGDVDKSKVVVWSYKITGGKITPEQEIKLHS